MTKNALQKSAKTFSLFERQIENIISFLNPLEKLMNYNFESIKEFNLVLTNICKLSLLVFNEIFRFQIQT